MSVGSIPEIDTEIARLNLRWKNRSVMRIEHAPYRGVRFLYKRMTYLTPIVVAEQVGLRKNPLFERTNFRYRSSCQWDSPEDGFSSSLVVTSHEIKT